MVSGSVTLDLNTLGATSSAIDVRQYLDWTVVPTASGTWDRAQVVWRWSGDGTDWRKFPDEDDVGATTRIRPVFFGTIPYARYIRAETRAVEGSASTATLTYYGNAVAPPPFGVSAALGSGPGSPVIIRGYRNVVSATLTNRAFDLFSTNSTSVHTYPGMGATGAETIQIQPSSANDTAAGTGAREITVIGLDGSWNEVSESIATNGVTAVTTTQTFLRVNEAYVSSAGSLLRNADTITLTQSTSTLLMGQIFKHGGSSEAGFGRTLNGFYSVPAGKKLVVLAREARLEQEAAAAGASYGVVSLAARATASTATSPWLEVWACPVGSGGAMADRELTVPDVFPEKSDIKLRIIETDTSTIEAAAELRCLLLDA